MDRTTTTQAFMRGFYKVAYERGLTVDQAAELHTRAIFEEACSRSPEFARGFDKVAAVAPWWKLFDWGRQEQPARQQQSGGFWDWLTYGNSNRSQSKLDSQLDAYARRRAGQSQQTTSRPQPAYTPLSMPVSDAHRGRHAEQFVQEQQTARGKTPVQAQQSADNGMRGRNAIHQSTLQMKQPKAPAPQMGEQPKKPDLRGSSLGQRLEGPASDLDFRVRSPSGISAARG